VSSGQLAASSGQLAASSEQWAVGSEQLAVDGVSGAANEAFIWRWNIDPPNIEFERWARSSSNRPLH
jgi:X-X-X-Leu-X-X-Gly heptad repeat protein